MIVLEGPDGSGKTTLATYLSWLTGWRVQHSGGPEKYEGEMKERVKKYVYDGNYNANLIFDRHPCVSDSIYNPTENRIPQELMDLFYGNGRMLLVYCPAKLKHVPGEHDTLAHWEMVVRRDREIRSAYRRWAEEKAHVIFRPDQGYFFIHQIVKGMFHV